MPPRRRNGADAIPVTAPAQMEGVVATPVDGAAPLAPDPTRPYAALDLGTNSCRMLVAQPRDDGFQVIDSFSKSVQLGVGLSSSGVLSRGSMQRTVQALRICQRKFARHRVKRMRLVATEACRRATNADSFIAQVRRETGLALEIIAPAEEARLAVISCASLVDPTTEQLLVVDIGGGSTELVWIDLSGVPQEERPGALMRLPHGLRQGDHHGAARIVDWISVPLGVATLKDMFSDVASDAARFALMSCHFEEQLADFTPYQTLHARDGFQIIGTSGTVTTVAASYLATGCVNHTI